MTTTTRGMTRDELTEIGYQYVEQLIRVEDAKATESTAEQLIESAVDSMRGREDVPELRQEDGDVEIVLRGIRAAIKQRIEDEAE